MDQENPGKVEGGTQETCNKYYFWLVYLLYFLFICLVELSIGFILYKLFWDNITEGFKRMRENQFHY